MHTSARRAACYLAAITVSGWHATASCAYDDVLKYVGMNCAKIQRDSTFHRHNEIFVNTIVHDAATGRAFDARHPRGARYYANVRAGTVKRGPVTTLWAGRSRELRLLVAMWEHDDGGKLVDEFTYAFSTAAKIYLATQAGGATMAGRGVLGAATMASRTAKNVTNESGGPGELDRFLAKNMRHVVGANNDPIGHATVTLTGGNWSGTPLKSAHGMRYHFRTTHRRGGARCHAYFRFERGASHQASAETLGRDPEQFIDAERHGYGASPGEPYPSEPPRRHDYAPEPPPMGELFAHNRCDRPVYVAESFRLRNGRWQTAGWTELAPGERQAIDPGHANRVVYAHATGGARPVRHDGDRHRIYLTVVDERFDYLDDDAPRAGSGRETAAFYRITRPSVYRDYTIHFDCTPDAYRVVAHNRCARDLYIAMHYRGIDGTRMTEGYSPFKPGEARDLNIEIGEPRVGFYASGARPVGWNGQATVHEVISKGFKHRAGQGLTGPGKRRERFLHVPLRANEPVQTVEFVCHR